MNFHLQSVITFQREVVYLKDVLEIKRKSHGFGDNKALFYFKVNL